MKIEFLLKDKYMKSVPARIVDYPTIAKGKEQLLGADEVVLKCAKVSVLFDYPMQKPEIFTFYDAAGFTRLSLFKVIHDGYVAIYKDPQKYGVYGHGINDLYLEAALIEDDGSVKLVMGS